MKTCFQLLVSYVNSVQIKQKEKKNLLVFPQVLVKVTPTITPGIVPPSCDNAPDMDHPASLSALKYHSWNSEKLPLSHYGSMIYVQFLRD